jgi:hypothetical protein
MDADALEHSPFFITEETETTEQREQNQAGLSFAE